MHLDIECKSYLVCIVITATLADLSKCDSYMKIKMNNYYIFFNIQCIVLGERKLFRQLLEKTSGSLCTFRSDLHLIVTIIP